MTPTFPTSTTSERSGPTRLLHDFSETETGSHTRLKQVVGSLGQWLGRSLRNKGALCDAVDSAGPQGEPYGLRLLVDEVTCKNKCISERP